MDRKACEEWERRLPSIAAPSVLPRDAAKFHGLRDADEKPLVVVKFPHLVLKEVEEAGLYCQPVACEVYPWSKHGDFR